MNVTLKTKVRAVSVGVLLLTVLGLVLWLVPSQVVKEIRIDEKNNNGLQVILSIKSNAKDITNIQFWDIETPHNVINISNLEQSNGYIKALLMPLEFEKKYRFKILFNGGQSVDSSDRYTFQTKKKPFWFADLFHLLTNDVTHTPNEFKEGLILLNGREAPGMVYMIDVLGHLRWYHEFSKTGVKVVTFSKDETLLNILGTSSYKTSYGNQIIEINLAGDTLANLYQGLNDFNEVTVHHDLLKTKDGNIAVLVTKDQKIDFSSIGGKKGDTLKVDGIDIYNKSGILQWHWDVLKVLNPLNEKNILKDKTDWMHSNSLSYSKDGNFLISFYNLQQIWEIDSHTGNLVRTIGVNGECPIADKVIFDNAHDVSVDQDKMLLFDNGTHHQQSRIIQYVFAPDWKSVLSASIINIPKNLYNDRMGSVTAIGSNHYLFCSSKKNTIGLVDLNGNMPWSLETTMNPYRSVFIPKYKDLFQHDFKTIK